MFLERTARQPEVAAKLAALRARMADVSLDAVYLAHNANLAWATAGAATYIYEATDSSPVALLVTMERAYALTDSIEAPRLRDEQGLEALGYQLVVEPWYNKGKVLADLTAGKRVGSDMAGPFSPVMPVLQSLRSTLLPVEVERFRTAGRLAADTLDEAVRATRPGDSEHLLAARMAFGARKRGGVSVVNLVASDERIFQHRHPLPTGRQVERYAMLVLCLRYEGLIASVTRLVHFGQPPEEIRRKLEAVQQIDARMILGTKPGRTLSEMFELARTAYAEAGYPEAIEEHHQGGSTAYLPREVVVRPGLNEVIAPNQVFAWNPSIRGVKSEDTILLTETGIDVLTTMHGFPTRDVMVDGAHIARPEILIL